MHTRRAGVSNRVRGSRRRCRGWCAWSAARRTNAETRESLGDSVAESAASAWAGAVDQQAVRRLRTVAMLGHAAGGVAVGRVGRVDWRRHGGPRDIERT